MKPFLRIATIVAVTFTTPAFAADVGVSVSIGQPGFYGRIDIGDFPQPRVIYSEPRIIHVVPMEREPIYLRVPPGHARHWAKHCHEYNACGERVFFVQDDWYNREYVPRYQEQHRDRRDEYREDHHRGDHRNDRQGDYHDHGHDH
jgi:hypothetical protein